MPKPSIILTTKLLAPQLKSRVLPRTRLVERMLNARECKLILVCADAGYGKTTILAQLCARLGPAYVYYDLEPGDNDSARFLQYLVHGFQTRFPDLGKDLLDLLGETREPETLVSMLINDFITRVKGDFYFMLDDYHHLQRNMEIAKILDYLLRHIPANLHLVIASRSRPPLNLHYYEAKGELLLLDKEHLQFTEAEIRELFNSIHKLRIADADLIKIAEQSAGWITAVQLILQKILARERESPDETIRSSLAAGAPVFDYFAVEILEDHPPQIQDFLVRSSVLETIDPQVCDQLFQARNSAKLLEYINAENVFITKVGQGFRYHPLFRDFLIRRLKTTYPAKAVEQLYRRLADIQIGHHDYQEATDSCLQAADYQRAARILIENFSFWRDTGAFESYLDLVGRIPVSLQDRHPELLVNKMFCLYGVGNIAAIMNNHAVMLRRLRREKDRKPLIDYLLFMSLIMNLIREHRKSLRFAQQAERLTANRDYPRKITAYSRMTQAHLELLEFDKARSAAELAVKTARATDSKILQTRTFFSLASFHWLSGDFRSALSMYGSLLRDHLDDIGPFNKIRTYLNAALVAVENCREPETEEYLGQAEFYLQKYPTRPMRMDLEYWKGHVRMWQNRHQEALTALDKSLEISRSLGLHYPEFLSLNMIAQVYTNVGDLTRARSFMDRAQSLIPNNLPVTHRFEFTMIRLNLEIDEHRFEDAKRTMDELRSIAPKAAVDYNTMAYLCLLAYYHMEVGELPATSKYLKRALALCEKREYAYALTYDCRINRQILEYAVKNGIATAYLTRLLPMVRPFWGRDLAKQIQVGQGRYDLACSFFGPFTVIDSRGRAAHPKWRTRGSRSMLAWLLWSGEHGCTKDQLIEEFWPQRNLKQAGHNLQVEISAIRKILAPIAGKPAEDIIAYRQDTYRINPGLIVKTDVVELNSLLREARQADQDPKKKLKLLKQAAELCRPGFCMDIKSSWCTEPRQHFLEERQKILEEIRAGKA